MVWPPGGLTWPDIVPWDLAWQATSHWPVVHSQAMWLGLLLLNVAKEGIEGSGDTGDTADIYLIS